MSTRTVDRFVIPTAVGVVASAIWWGLTLNWVAAGSALVGIVLITLVILRVIPALLDVQRLKNSEVAGIYENQATAENEMKSLALQARRIDILTIRGLGIIGLNDSVLRRQLFDTSSVRRRIRILLLDPDGEQAPRRAREIGESPEAFIHGINLAIQRMRELADLQHHQLEVYLYDRQPCWRLISLDDTHYVSVFGQRIEGHRATMYKVDGSRQSTLHEALSRMFEEMCDTGVRKI